MRERRRDQRYSLQGRVSLHLDGQHYELPAADISVSGIGVELDAAVFGPKPNGQVGTCRIESDDLAIPVESFVSIMSIRRHGDRYFVGLRFESISDKHFRVIRAFESLCQARRRRHASPVF